MTTGVVLLNFGEPEEPTRENVVDYLERIFLSNMSLEGEMTEEDARKRAHELAERRAPGLLEEYDEMGPSPLVPQARHQAEMLETELVSRGYDVETYNGMQYTEPFIREAVEEARDDGVEKLIGIPVYPLCGRTTTVESLEFLSEEVEEMGWDVSYQEITGWHEHPKYVELRTDNLRSYVESEGIDLNDDEATLLFSAHGTPIKYLREGSRYDEYVEEFCSWVADDVGVEDYLIGYQNHANRDDVDWTQPETEEVVEEVEGDRVVVEPLSFMHEQSETLSELDIELREECEEMGLEMHRVPVPHDDPRLADVLADLAEPFIADEDPSEWEMGQCKCKDTPGTMCFRPAD